MIYGPGAPHEGQSRRPAGRAIIVAGRLPGIVGADRAWSYAYVDDVADAHVQRSFTSVESPRVRRSEARTRRRCACSRSCRELTGQPLAAAYSICRRIARSGWLEEQRAALTGRPPLITRGAVEIFRHDWRLDSSRSIDELSYRIVPLETGLKSMLSPR